MRRLVTAITTAVLAVSIAPPGMAAPATTAHLKVPAAARVEASTCPFTDEVVESDTFCQDVFVLYFREGEPSSLRAAQWTLFVVSDGVVLHPDGTVTELFHGEGAVENPTGSFDLKRFASAAVRATVPLSDGRNVDVDLAWDMSAVPLNHGGNDSLYNVEFGIDRHFADRCLTLNQLAHQQWRAGAPGVIAGTVAGLDVQALFLNETDPFLAGRSVFTFVEVPHGGCS